MEAKSDVEQELLNLERQYWQAMKDKDAETATRLTELPCIIVGAQGVSSIDSEAAYQALLGSSSWAIDDFRIEEGGRVRLLTDDVAVVAYKVHEDLMVGGDRVSLDAADTSVWVRRDGQWRCAMHTESISGDPFGRDRQAS
jgi:hypothetical protein